MNIPGENEELNIPIIIKESQGNARKVEPLAFGIPFKKGQIFDVTGLSLFDGELKLATDIDVTAYWSDKSIKWAFIDSQVSLPAGEANTLYLRKQRSDERENKGIVVSEHQNSTVINTGIAEFVVTENSIIPIPLKNGEESNCFKNASVTLINEEDRELIPKISNRYHKLSTNGLKLELVSEGEFQYVDDLVLNKKKNKKKKKKGKILPQFLLRLTFYADKTAVKLQFTLMNQNAAVHPGGKWDLGGGGAYNFKDLSIEIPLSKSAKVIYKEQRESSWEEVDSHNFLFYQCSSGGEHWNSRNHVNSKGDVPIDFKGFRVINGNESLKQGSRANPLISINSPELRFTAQVKNFWQEFPKALSVHNSLLRLSLFPREFKDNFELQGGEQKTHSVYFDFGDDIQALYQCNDPIEVSFSPKYIASTQVISWLSSDSSNNILLNFIYQKGIKERSNFFAKREMIDEFGWRNFGEIYADHESVGHKGGEPFISHYNNQYDPLYGFVRMFLQSGDSHWFELMNDLASHIVDIDIYNTDLDRPEFNRGLFWHTDHYLEAETCTHRTFSKFHLAAYQDHAGGGGPGEEHCYSTGLVAHYFLTGCEQSKTTVINLAKWFISLQEGQGLLFERILQAKNKDLLTFKRVLKGECLPKIKYPFTRGTGNYISTLLDAYSLTAEQHYLKLVESVIRQTIHPLEDISLRHLEDKEVTWSYIVFLQSITKYLEVKSAMTDYDDEFYYARDSLLNMTEWILENEYPFLDKPEILEFPNVTWIAQDLRKAQLLFITSQYTDKSDAYIKKANYYFDYVMQKVQGTAESEYSRILILLMQNQGPEDCYPVSSQNEDKIRHVNPSSYGKAPRFSPLGIVFSLGFDLLKRFFKLSIAKEKAWLKYRTH